MNDTVGVVVPCKDEAATIRRCLEALREQRPRVSRIVVVDNGSTDGSDVIAEELADEVLRLPGVSISELRNRGAAAVEDADVLAFVDADTEVHPGWLQAGLDALATGADLVGSRSLPTEGGSWVAGRWAAIEAARAHGDSKVWSQHLLIRTACFQQLGGFADIPTGEDADLSIRLEDLGGTVALVPGMVATHHGFPTTVRAFLRRERWHTRAAGWFPRMSRSSRALVCAGAGWAALGAGALVGAGLTRAPRPAAVWTAGSLLALPLLGAMTSRRPSTVVRDGALLGIWTAVRVVRLPREVASAARSRPS